MLEIWVIDGKVIPYMYHKLRLFAIIIFRSPTSRRSYFKSLRQALQYYLVYIISQVHIF